MIYNILAQSQLDGHLVVQLKNHEMPKPHAITWVSDLMQNLVQDQVVGVQPKIKGASSTAYIFPLHFNIQINAIYSKIIHMKDVKLWHITKSIIYQ